MDPDATAVTGGQQPQRLAQYELLRRIGAGAMGVVHQARDVDLGRLVAIKLLHREGDAEGSSERQERFLREARAAAQMVHPNVALVYQVGWQEGTAFIAMEWLEGEDLSAWVKRQGPIPWRDAVRAAADAAAGLAAAHAAGLVHRDVKPSNLMRLASGVVKLVDFGLARFAGTASDLTHTGALLGTPSYLSPEQCRGEEATAASDLYALGCTLYHLLTGGPPFPAPHVAGVLYKHLNEPVPDPGLAMPGLPGALWLILQRAMAKPADARYASAAEMLHDLRALLDQQAESRSATVDLAIDPEPAARALPGHLPVEPSPFVGREAQVAELAHAVGSSPLVTLTGPGGTGKTRLALHLARSLALQQPVWFAELAPLPAGDDIAPAIAALMALREAAGETAADALAKALRGAPALLVLDNCEHVLASAARLAALLLAECPLLRIVATSRELLGIAGERLLPVPPLAIGSEGAAPAQLRQCEAVQLFAERAGNARPGFVVDESNAATVAAICRRVDGMPLAIELAAARLKVLSLVQIEARLADLFGLLSGGAKTLEPRQQTLRALIGWSYDLLDDAERRVFEGISVFAGDFDIDAAEAIVGDQDVEVLDLLAQLVDKSLLVAFERDEQVRYRMLQTIRRYAAERLGASGNTNALRRRHYAHYSPRAIAAAKQLRSDSRKQHLAWFARERDNLLAALDAAALARDFAVASPLIAALANYWYDQGRFAEGLARIERYLAVPPNEDEALAPLFQWAGNIALFTGRHELARGWYERGLALARRLGDARLEARFIGQLGGHALAAGRFDDAAHWYGRSLDLSRQLGERWNEVKALNDLALIHYRQGRLDRAREHYAAALGILHALDSRSGIALVSINLGELALNAGAPDEALSHYRAALDYFTASGDEWNAAYARAGLATCALQRGDLAEARRGYDQALAVLRETGDKDHEAHTLDGLARLAIAANDLDGARAQAGQALALRLALTNPADIAESLETLAIAGASDDPQRAARRLGCARRLRDEAGTPAAPIDRARLAELDALLGTRLGAGDLALALAAGRAAEPADLAR